MNLLGDAGVAGDGADTVAECDYYPARSETNSSQIAKQDRIYA